MKKPNLKRGFTLIELLVVMTIIAVISAAAIVNFRNAAKSARDGRRKTDLESVRQALVLYKVQTGCYPVGTYNQVVATLIAGQYLSSPAPQDPSDPDIVNSGDTYEYSYVYNTTCTGGLSNVFSLNALLEQGGTYHTVTNP